MLRVIIESPYAGNIKLNEMYGEFCLRDAIVNHNESPYASHLLYTRPNVLRDNIKEERDLGISAGFCWREIADATVFYMDLGMTPGMIKGIDNCKEKNIQYGFRCITKILWNEFKEKANAEGIYDLRK